MALKTLGTAGTTSLAALPPWSAVLSPADVAAIGQTVAPDRAIASILSGYGPGVTAVLASGTTHTSTLLDSIVVGLGAPLAQIKIGDLVIGAGIPPGTFVSAKPTSTSVTLSKAATASASGVYLVFEPAPPPGLELGSGGLLRLPGGRGTIKLLPGDVVAVDNTGWPIVVSAAAIGYLGSLWALS